MNVFQVFQNLTSSQFQQHHLVLRNGQIVNATLLDMFANGDAKINIQGFTVRAKLETPLAKGEHTFMQVESFQNGIVRMKIIANDEKASTNVPENNIKQMLKNADLPTNSSWRQLIQQMLQRNIPLLPDILQNGVQLLGKQPTPEQQQSWLTMLERGIPITASTHQAIHQLLYGQSISQLIDNFKGLVAQYLSDKNIPQILNQETINNDNKHINQVNQTSQGIVINRGNQGNLSSQSLIANQANLSIQVNSSNPDNNYNQSNIISNYQVNTQANINSTQNNTSEISLDRTAINQNQDIVKNIVHINENLNQLLAKGNELLALKQQTPQINSQPLLLQIFKMIGYQHEQNTFQLVQDLLSNEARVNDAPLNNNSASFQDNIKQMLIQLINNNQYPTAIREIANQILNNITGQQLFSSPQDTQNILQNIMVQIPINWGNNQQDTLTIQVQGRKGKKAIDPNNCSIYLELAPPNLGDLGVFIQIVNKVVSVKIFTENNQLKHLVDSTASFLRTGLSEQGYLLSYVRLELPNQQNNNKKELSAYRKVSPKGIDIRI